MHGGQCFAARAEVEVVPVVQVECVRAEFLVQRLAAEALEHPAVVLDALFLDAGAGVAEHGGQQVGERHVRGHREFEHCVRGAEPQPAQSCDGTTVHVSLRSRLLP